MNIIREIEGFISGKFNELKLFIAMVKLEAKLAGLSVFPLLLSVCMLFVILITLWLSIMVFMGYGVIAFHGKFWQAISLVIVFNLVLLGILLVYLKSHLKNMSFQKTRKYLEERERMKHGQLQEGTSDTNRDAGKRITRPAASGDEA